MDIFSIFWSPEKYLEFLPFLIRSSFFVMAVPMFSFAFLPFPVRSGISFAVALAIKSGYQGTIEFIPASPAEIVAVILSELILSFMIFLIIRIFFLAPQLSGEAIGFQVGFGLMTVSQPFEDVPLSVVAEFFFLLSMVLFFLLDLQIPFFWGLKKSFELVPPFAFVNPEGVQNILMERTKEAFSVAVQIALPLFLTMFIVEIAIAIVSRSIPQFNIFVIGFPIKVFLGILIFTFTLDRISFFIGEFMMKFTETFSDILKALH